MAHQRRTSQDSFSLADVPGSHLRPQTHMARPWSANSRRDVG
jgi:hypothetical protein